MTYLEFICKVDEALNYDTAEGLRLEYGFPPDCEFTAEGLIKAYDIIYAASRCDFSKLVELGGGNLSALCRSYKIPFRTAQKWMSGERHPSPYIIELVGYALLSTCEKETHFDY